MKIQEYQPKTRTVLIPNLREVGILMSALATMSANNGEPLIHRQIAGRLHDQIKSHYNKVYGAYQGGKV